MFNNIDFVILSETSKEIGIEVSEFKSIVQATSKVGKSGRGSSGGLVQLYKNKFHDRITIEKSSPQPFMV